MKIKDQRQFQEHYTHFYKTPVAWGEMDALGHVNNIIYFRYFESVRMLMFEQFKFNDFLKSNAIGPILSQTKAKFIAPLYFPDDIVVGGKIDKIDIDRFTMDYGLWSIQQNAFVAKGEGQIMAFDYSLKSKVDIPQVWLNHF